MRRARVAPLLASAGLALGLALLAATAAGAAETATPESRTIMFVCLHGSANSQMAAAHFNRIARERGLAYVAVSRGIEVNASIPTRIRDGLSLDDLEPVNDVPRPLTPAEASAVARVFAFDTVPADKRGAAEVTYWSDVPPGVTDYVAARDVIMRHLDQLVPMLVEKPGPRKTIHGKIIGIDEWNDRITLRPGVSTSRDFRVQDGLVFDLVQLGDQVEITVETVNGVETVVGTIKE